MKKLDKSKNSIAFTRFKLYRLFRNLTSQFGQQLQVGLGLEEPNIWIVFEDLLHVLYSVIKQCLVDRLFSNFLGNLLSDAKRKIDLKF